MAQLDAVHAVGLAYSYSTPSLGGPDFLSNSCQQTCLNFFLERYVVFLIPSNLPSAAVGNTPFPGRLLYEHTLTDSPEQKVSAPLSSQHVQKPKNSLPTVTESIIGVPNLYTPSRDDCCTPKHCSPCGLHPSSPATWALRHCGLLEGA